MTPEEACRLVLGDDRADRLIADMGLQWAVVAAMATARLDNTPLEAIKVIRDFVRESKTPKGGARL